MNVTEEIRKKIGALVNGVKKVRLSYSTNGGVKTTTLSGEDAIRRIEELVKKAEISRVKIISPKKKVLADFPLIGASAGAAVMLFLSILLAALAAATIIVTGCDIEIEAKEKSKPTPGGAEVSAAGSPPHS